jgi:hypothetical protein
MSKIKVQMKFESPISSPNILTYVVSNSIIPLSPCACLREAAPAKAGERAGVRGDHSMFTPTSILPYQGGG